MADVHRTSFGARMRAVGQSPHIPGLPAPGLLGLAPFPIGLLGCAIPLWPIRFLQEGDQRWISTVAQALHLLGTLYGPFPNCYGIGRCTKVGTSRSAVPMAPIVPVLCPPWSAQGHL